MHIAFYAPMKSPQSPRPSGDRTLARLWFKALEQTGAKVTLVSSLRSWQKTTQHQKNIYDEAHNEAHKISQQNPHFDLWFTYHVYYKAPDLLGPLLSRYWGIDYWIAEASYNPKYKKGPWKKNLLKTKIALKQANIILEMNPKDSQAIKALLSPEKSHLLVKNQNAFMDTNKTQGINFTNVKTLKSFTLIKQAQKEKIASLYGLNPQYPWLITCAMMRTGDKNRSYQLLNKALDYLNQNLEFSRYQHIIIGDGVQRSALETLYKSQDKAREKQTFFLGACDYETLYPLYQACDIFVWPAIGEAIGMAIVEAQNAGLPVIAGRTQGLETIILEGITGILPPYGSPQALAHEIKDLLTSPQRCFLMSQRAQENVRSHHSLQSVVNHLKTLFHQRGLL